MRVPAFRRGKDEDRQSAQEREQRFLDKLRDRLAQMEARRLPPIWDVPHVFGRMVEGEAIAQRRRDRIGPPLPNTCWPHHVYTTEDMEEQKRFNATVILPEKTSRPDKYEIARQEQAMGWAARYCGHDALAAAAVTYGTRWAALDLDIAAMIDSQWVGEAESFDRKKRQGLEAIARGLNLDRVAVT